ncbi:MAG: PP2C family protein-serine/threonine phosphatase [Nitrospinota bacterium]
MFNVAVAGISDTGVKRSANQDTIYIDLHKRVFIQADGMGGHRGGKEASLLATQIVSNLLCKGGKFPEYTEEDTKALSEYNNLAKSVYASILAADIEISNTGTGSDADLKGMGSTIDVLCINNDKIIIGHVGDSRVYRLRDESFEQLTSDHSLMNELKHKFHFTTEKAATLPYGNRITRALGYLSARNVDIIEHDALPGDIYLLCSDGLTGPVSDDKIKSIISSNYQNLEEATTKLVSEANSNGGPDNISVILVKILKS